MYVRTWINFSTEMYWRSYFESQARSEIPGPSLDLSDAQIFESQNIIFHNE